MNEFKVIVDRPKVSSKQIQQQMDFDHLLSSQKVMAKPFHKSIWFYGSTGLATLGVITLTSVNLESKSQEIQSQDLTSSPPPQLIASTDLSEKTSKPIDLTSKSETTNPLPIEKKSTSIKKTTNQKPESKTNDHISQLDETVNTTESLSSDVNTTKEIHSEMKSAVNEKSTFSYMDLHPSISGVYNGEISKEQLFNDQGLLTKADIKVIHFELHLILGISSKVYVSDGHELTEEMKSDINQLSTGDELYFENIQGETVDGDVIRLSPLKYVLLN